MGVMIIFALSYNMLLGQTGLLSFGHAVYYGLGGFVAIHAMNAVIHGKLGVPVAIMPIVGGAGGARLRRPVRPRLDQARRAGLLHDLARHRRARVLELVHPAHLLRRRGGDHHQPRQARAAVRAQVRAADRSLLSHRDLVLPVHRGDVRADPHAVRTPVQRGARQSRARAIHRLFGPADPPHRLQLRRLLRRDRGRPGGDQFRDHECTAARRPAIGLGSADGLYRRRRRFRRPDPRRDHHHLPADQSVRPDERLAALFRPPVHRRRVVRAGRRRGMADAPPGGGALGRILAPRARLRGSSRRAWRPA